MEYTYSSASSLVAMSDTSSISSLHDYFSSSPPPPKPSGRKGNKKVRTGCITCKIRKVKCDEGKPACLRCVKTGRKCDGYPVPKPRAARIRSPSPTPELENAEQFRAFDYFRNRSAILLGGITIEGREFWGGIVVKLAATEPAVRHAVLALSSLHESLAHASDGAKGAASDFAFLEYGKAIAAVRQWDTTSPTADPSAIPLLVCVLFICIEFLMDYEQAAQLHICQGRSILARMDQQSLSSPVVDMVLKVLVPIYSRLSLATYLFAVYPEPIPSHLTADPGDEAMSFSSMQEARDILFHLLDSGLRFSVEAKPTIYDPTIDPWVMENMEARKQQILDRLSRWNVAFTVFKATVPTETPASRATQSLLYIWYHAGVVWTSMSLSTCEIMFDNFESDFAAILSHAVSALAEAGSLRREDSAFTFETELLAPVYWVAVKCRHPLLRRAALRLLARDELKRRRENLWRAPALAAVSSRVIETEEGPGLARYNDGLTESIEGLELYWHTQNEVTVPITQAPTLYKESVIFTHDQLATDIANEAPLGRPRQESPNMFMPVPQNFEAAATLNSVDPERLKSPYGVPESQRIKNAVIGPHKDGGVWLTTFMDPRPGGLEWETRKVFLQV